MYNGFIISDKFRNNALYNGNTDKFGVTVDGVNYIIKEQKKEENSSVFSEYVASRFIKCLNTRVQEVWLGIYEDRVVDIIKDFTKPGVALRSFGSTRQSSEDTDIARHTGYTYNEIMILIDKHIKLGVNAKVRVKQQFWRQFILDAILGNRDRHGGNWGYLTNGIVSAPAPIYDNGGSLFPDVAKIISKYSKNRKKFIMDRSDYFPASIIKKSNISDKDTRMNYFEALNDLKDIPELAVQLDYFRNTLDIDKICRAAYITLVQDNNIIPPIYKEFYLYVICTRYLRMVCRHRIETAYKIADETILRLRKP